MHTVSAARYFLLLSRLLTGLSVSAVHSSDFKVCRIDFKWWDYKNYSEEKIIEI
jgi:hypothetical protein